MALFFIEEKLLALSAVEIKAIPAFQMAVRQTVLARMSELPMMSPALKRKTTAIIPARNTMMYNNSKLN